MPRSTNWFNNDSNAAATVYLESLFPKFWTQWQQHPDELTSIIESHIKQQSHVSSRPTQRSNRSKLLWLRRARQLDLDKTQTQTILLPMCARHWTATTSRIAVSKDQNLTPITTQLATRLGVGKSGPHVIYSVRNYVMHPLDSNTYAIKQQHLEQLDDSYSPYFYLHDLCQFYLEYLLLIGLCDWKPDNFRILAEKR